MLYRVIVLFVISYRPQAIAPLIVLHSVQLLLPIVRRDYKALPDVHLNQEHRNTLELTR